MRSQQLGFTNQMLLLFGFACFILAGIDAACWFMGESLTGSGWSPIIFASLGVLIFLVAAPRKENRHP